MKIVQLLTLAFDPNIRLGWKLGQNLPLNYFKWCYVDEIGSIGSKWFFFILCIQSTKSKIRIARQCRFFFKSCFLLKARTKKNY
jgi:hypothetical protein